MKKHDDIAIFAHQLVQLEREEFFGIVDATKWLPSYNHIDAGVMCPPYVGANYQRDGITIISINPGGGNDTSNLRSVGDALLYPKIHKFKNTTKDIESYYWDDFIPTFKEVMLTWKIYRDMLPVLDAASVGLDDIAYFNFIPYRGRDNKYPSGKTDMNSIIPNAFSKFVNPLLNQLRPSLMVNFGKQVDVYFSKYNSGFKGAMVSWNRERAARPSVVSEREETLRYLRTWRLERTR